MEGEHRRRIPSPPLNFDGDVYDDQQMSVSASDSSSVTGENREETLRFAENAMLNDRGPWTNGKHDMYLNQLELSFVKKLHGNKCLLGSRSGSRSVSGKSLRNDVSSYESGCQQSISTSRGKPLPSAAAADFHIIIKSASVYKSKYMAMHTTSVSKPMGYVNHCHRTKHAQRVASFGSATEGTGQNFIAENYRNGYSSQTPARGQLTDAAENQNLPTFTRPESDLPVTKSTKS